MIDFRYHLVSLASVLIALAVGIVLGAGAKILGRVTIGACAKIAASSVVLENVPPHTTVAGVPAVIVNDSIPDNPALDMNQRLCN